MDLSRIAVERGAVFGAAPFDPDGLGEGGLSHPENAFGHLLGVDGDFLPGFSLGETEEFLNHLSALVGAVLDEVEVVLVLVVPVSEQVDPQEDRNEGVVQVVGDAGGEGAEAFQALGSKGLTFGGAAGGAVPEEDEIIFLAFKFQVVGIGLDPHA